MELVRLFPDPSSHSPAWNNPKDSVLSLILGNGKTMDLVDASKEGDDNIWYSYQNYFPDINVYLIRGQLYEGDCYLVVNRKNGQSSYIIGEIYPNPKNSGFIAINADLEAGYSSNGIQLVELSEGKFVKKFTIEGGDWGPVALKWINNRSFILKVLEWKGEEPFQYQNKFYKLTFSTILPIRNSN